MRSKGFTLIEVMIVIAIVGILLAVAIPVWKQSQCEGDHSPECKAIRAQAARAKTYAPPSQAVSTQCQHGVLFDAAGKQVIGPNGNGVPCN